MAEIVRCAVHPIACIAEVCDILSLSAVSVVQDNAYSAFGDIASELGLAVIIGDGLSLSFAGPLAAESVAVGIPSVNISGSPTEVVGQQEGALYKNVVGTYLHGPLLSKSPEVADWLIERALARRAAKDGQPAPVLAPLDDSAERAANEFMRRKLGVHR